MTERLAYTASEVAEMLGVSRQTVSRWVAQGALPRLDLPGARVLIPAHAVHELTEVSA